MAKKLQLRRGTTTQHNSFTGAEGEVTIDTTKDSLVVHDGSTQGGHPIAKSSDISAMAATTGATFTGDILVDNEQEVRFGENDSNGANYVSLKAPATIGSNVTWTLPAADGSADQHLKTDGSGALGWATDSTVDNTKMPLGGGTFTGDVSYANGKASKYYENDGNGSNYVKIKAPAAVTSDVTLTLPNGDGDADEFLKTDGSGNLSWGTSSSGATGGGSDKIFVENERTVTTSYSISGTKNAHSVGPIAINNTIVVTIPANSTWLVS